MAKSYIHPQFREQIVKNFLSIYRRLLIEHVFKDNEKSQDEIESYVDKFLEGILNDRKTRKLMEQIVSKAFKDEDYNLYLAQYEKMTEDNYLGRFLEIFKFTIETTSSYVFDSNQNYKSEKIKSYFQQFKPTVIEVYKSLEKDYMEGNFWWTRNDASALRRQLSSDTIVFSPERFNNLVRTYLKQDYDFKRRDETKYNMSLIQKLDAVMKKQGANLTYIWKEYNGDGSYKKCESPVEPKNVSYYITAYTSKDSEKYL